MSTAHLAMAKCAFIKDDMRALYEWTALAIQRPPEHMKRLLDGLRKAGLSG